MKKFALTLTCAALASTAPVAIAVPLNITVDSSGALLNGVGIANSTQASMPPNNPGDNLDFLKDLIGNWNGVPLVPALPSAGSLALDQGSLGGGTTYSGPSGYQYVVFHWGAGNAGGGGVSKGGWWAAYYLGGESISFTGVPVVNGETVGGFSSARYFGTVSVPDGGATVLLLGLGFAGIGLIRRRA